MRRLEKLKKSKREKWQKNELIRLQKIKENRLKNCGGPIELDTF
jgi:hypothetical protein